MLHNGCEPLGLPLKCKGFIRGHHAQETATGSCSAYICHIDFSSTAQGDMNVMSQASLATDVLHGFTHRAGIDQLDKDALHARVAQTGHGVRPAHKGGLKDYKCAPCRTCMQLRRDQVAAPARL